MSLVFHDKISCHWVRWVPPNEKQKRANASLTRRPGISVTLQCSQSGTIQLTRYAIEIGNFGICILT